MSPYLSDCMPEERVAIQPPSVEWVKLSGKWPSVQPLRVELPLEVRTERAGLDPGEAGRRVHRRALGACRATSSETTVRAPRPGASRLPEMLVPPPNGMSTASASSTARTTAPPRPRRPAGRRHPGAGRARRDGGGRGHAGSCRGRGRRGRADDVEPAVLDPHRPVLEAVRSSLPRLGIHGRAEQRRGRRAFTAVRRRSTSALSRERRKPAHRSG